MKLGFTLIELIVAMVLVGVLSIFVGFYLNEELKMAVKNRNITKTSTRINQFYDSVNKLVRRQKGALTLMRFDPPRLENGNETARTLTWQSANIGQGDNVFSVSIENRCEPYPQNLPALLDLGISQPDIDEIRRCSGCEAPALPNAILVKGGVTEPVLPGNRTGLDGEAITGVVCLRVSGQIVPTPGALPPGEVRMTVIALSPFHTGAMRRAKVIKSQVTFPIKRFGENSIIILPSILDWIEKP